MTEFKVGDRVRTISDATLGASLMNREGVIEAVGEGGVYDIDVDFNYLDLHNVYSFARDELIPVNEVSHDITITLTKNDALHVATVLALTVNVNPIGKTASDVLDAIIEQCGEDEVMKFADETEVNIMADEEGGDYRSIVMGPIPDRIKRATTKDVAKQNAELITHLERVRDAVDDMIVKVEEIDRTREEIK